MSNDVERLRQALRDKAQEIWERGRRGAPLLSVNDAMEVLEQMGVTLPTPPRATPLEAAARASVEPDHRWELLRRRAITAAVGALSDEAIMADSQFPTPEGTEWRVVANRIRAAWLARLTEGGAA